jgi:NlpC/P60 family putative phage cell wall peptidase
MSIRDQVVSEARSWLGTPYQHQASLKGAGCDCLGLVRGVWRGVYGKEPEFPPPYSPDWAEAGGREALHDAAMRHLVPVALKALQGGDVVLFRWRAHLPAKHAAIISSVGAGAAMIHAHDGISVCEVPLSNWWRRRMAFGFSFPEEA